MNCFSWDFFSESKWLNNPPPPLTQPPPPKQLNGPSEQYIKGSPYRPCRSKEYNTMNNKPLNTRPC